MQNLLPENAVAFGGKKVSMLPLLIVLFLISYGLLAMLVVEQAHTIEAQRTLIRQLFTDSVELTTLKGNAIRQQQHLATKPRTPSSQVQTPSSQDKTKSPRVAPESKVAVPNKTNKLHRKLPQMPPKDSSDTADDRRNLYSI
ncbi:MAG TPA: hypothetical protein VMH85_16455 [Terriglobales bacterium]|nr:hypothetical protein [Terriglobales bacterium]